MLHLKLAFRNILRQKRRSFLTGLSMVLGFVMAAFTLGVVEGSYGNIIRIFTEDHTGHVQIHKTDYLDRPTLYKQIGNLDEVLQKTRAVDGVVAAAPRIYAPSLVYAGDRNTVTTLIGIDPEAERHTSTIEKKRREGPFLTAGQDAEGYDQVMVGATIAQRLHLEIGDEIILIGQGVDGSIANDLYKVESIVGDKTTYEADKIFLSLDAARRYLSMGPTAHEIAVITKSPDDAEPLATRIAAALGNETLSVAPWQKVEEIFFNTMKADKDSNKVTTLIIMAMIAIGVLNAVLMSVLERTKEYGLFRAVGTRASHVFWMIILETMLLGTIASAIGLAIAWPLLMHLSVQGIPIPTPVDVGGMPFDTILAKVSVATLTEPAVLVLATAFLVSLWPAARAARVTPIEALRSV